MQQMLKRDGNSSWGRKLIVQKRRAELNDFELYKFMLVKIKGRAVINREHSKLKKWKHYLRMRTILNIE